MSTRVAINGLGRIGRAMLKLVMDEPSLELVAVNDVVDVENLAYLLRFDTNYGRYSRRVTIAAGNLVIGGHVVRTLSVHDPLPARYAGVLGVSRDPLVSSDVIGDSRVSIIDLELTRVVDGDLVKVMSWYDNEWGYANQMLRAMVSAGSSPPAA